MHYNYNRLAAIWRPSKKDMLMLRISDNCNKFCEYYDSIQTKINKFSVIYELLAGMLYIAVNINLIHYVWVGYRYAK